MMMDLNHRPPLHHDDDDRGDSIDISQPISLRHGGGGIAESLQVGHTTISTSTASGSLPTTTTATAMTTAASSKLSNVIGSLGRGGNSDSSGEHASCKHKHKNKTMNANKESQKKPEKLDLASWPARRQHQQRKKNQWQQQQQHVPRLYYYPFLLVLLVMAFLSMSFSPFLVYNFLPDRHYHHHHPSSSSGGGGSTSSSSFFTLDSLLLSSPLLEQQFHPERITTEDVTTTTRNAAADSDILKFSKEEGVPSPIILSDNNNANNGTASSSSSIIRPLRPGIDYDQYTVRINTWKRPAQLRVALEHLSSASCRSSIAQVQVIWCLAQGPVPEWLLQFNHQDHINNGNMMDNFVVVEAHEENSLNERFNVLLEPPTFGILSVDDDVIRPCLALDAAFVKWTRNPHRMVGFDARSHVVTTTNNNNNNNNSNEVWAYGYLSTTQNMNRYSSSLTRFAFLHVDYLYSYMNHMPAQIRQVVAENLNCEDIAMSFWISKQASLYAASLSSYSSSSTLSVSQQQQLLPPPFPPQPPLLADLWVMQSQVKLVTGEKSISAGKDHKKLRDACVNDFANWLQLKGQLKLAEWVHYENTTVPAAATTTSSNHLRGGNEDDKTVANKAKKSVFECGAPMDASIAAAASEHVRASLTARAVKERMDLWKDNMHIMVQDLKQLSADTRLAAKNQLLASQ